MNSPQYRRILYRSLATGNHGRRDLSPILAVSRLNNGLDGISGLLWTDGHRYVQLLEGPPDSVALTFARIARDPRHEAIEIADDSVAAERVFGDWTMADLAGGADEDNRERLMAALRDAPAAVRRAFQEAAT